MTGAPMFKELFQYRDLLFMLTFRDIRIRYKQAAMGFCGLFLCRALPPYQLTAWISCVKIFIIRSSSETYLRGNPLKGGEL